VNASDTFFCPRLGAKLTRQACYERQKRLRGVMQQKPAWGPAMSVLDKYCATAGLPVGKREDPNDKCGLGAMHWQGFARGSLTYVEREDPAPRFSSIHFGRRTRPAQSVSAQPGRKRNP